MRDDLGTRMKENYEFRTRMFLPRRTYTIIRLDGKAFHSYTKGLDKPFDYPLMEDMAATTVHLCKQISGARFGYTQSDEISLLLTDFDNNQTEAWFGGNVQKMVSVAASIGTRYFNQRRSLRNLLGEGSRLALFDARVFTIPDPTEVANYFIWRQQDATRNSVSMAAQAQFSHKDLQGKGSGEMQEMLWQYKNINWNDYPVAAKRGQLVARETRTEPVTFTNKKTGETQTLPAVERSFWEQLETPIFTQSNWLSENIPTYQ